MKKKTIWLGVFFLLTAFLISSPAISKILFDGGVTSQVCYSPRHFSAVIANENTIQLSGGNTASYTTEEIISVTVYSATKETETVFLPTENHFDYDKTNKRLQIKDAHFISTDRFKVVFIDSEVAVHVAMTQEVMSNINQLYYMTAEAGTVIQFDLKPKGGKIRWHQSDSLQSPYYTLDDGQSYYNQCPIRIAKGTFGYFSIPAVATGNITMEAIYWYY